MGIRKKKEEPQYDLDAIRELASEANGVTEIAEILGIHPEVMYTPEIQEAFALGQTDMKINLRHWQFNAAKGGNVSMLQFLGRVYLGQREVTETTVNLRREDDELTKSLESLAAELDSEHGKREAT